jgi:hypothetical protein
MRARGAKSPKNQRDLVEKIQNLLWEALELQEMKWRHTKRGIGFHGVPNPFYIYPLAREKDMSGLEDRNVRLAEDVRARG